MNIFGFFEGLKSFNRVRIKTNRPEKILNMLTQHSIYISHIQIKDGSLEFRVLNDKIKKLNDILLKYKTESEVVEIYGTQKLAKEAKKRIVALSGAFVCLGAIFFLSSFVWSIEIYGTQGVNAAEVKYYLYEHGIKQSTAKKDIDEARIRVMLLQDFPSVADADVSLRGSSLKIALSEKGSPVFTYDKSTPCDLVAARDATIAFIQTYNGIQMVQKGDTVHSGDVLIAGLSEYGYELEEKAYTPVHAMGKVLAEETVSYNDIVVDLYQPIEGREHITEKTIYLFSKTLVIGQKYSEENMAAFYVRAQNIKFGPFELPVLYDEKKLYNISDCTMRTKAQLNEDIEKAVRLRLGTGCEILSLSYTGTTNSDNRLSVNVTAVYTQNIALEQEIKQ